MDKPHPEPGILPKTEIVTASGYPDHMEQPGTEQPQYHLLSQAMDVPDPRYVRDHDVLASLDRHDPMEEEEEYLNELPPADNVQVLIHMNDAYVEVMYELLAKVDSALAKNKQKQHEVCDRIANIRHSNTISRKKVPVLQYLPPYFKDTSGMCPPMSEEAKRKRIDTRFDPLMKEEKKWNANDIKILHAAVRQAILEKMVQPFSSKRRDLLGKLTASGRDTDMKIKAVWAVEAEELQRKIAYYTNLPDDDVFGDESRYELVDWLRIANTDFHGNRSAESIRLKWLNEQRPRWNSNPEWTKEELAKLRELREGRFVSWGLLADKLGTRRTPWHCFVKYKQSFQSMTKEWTPEEDAKLIDLVEMLKSNGRVPWDKVTYYMPGRHRQQVRTRYTRTLDKSVKHGRWTDQEDLLLMCAVERLGARDWSKVAKVVSSRTDTQCRERWVTVLDRRIITKEWSLEEDEKLLYAISVIGRGRWAKCSEIMVNRSPAQCRNRFHSLLTSKIRFCMASTNATHPSISFIGVQNTGLRSYSKGLHQRKIFQQYLQATGSEIDRDEFIVKALSYAKPRKKCPDHVLSAREKAELLTEMKAISEKYKRGEPPLFNDILARIPLEEKDVMDLMRRENRKRFIRSVATPYHVKIRRLHTTLQHEDPIPDSWPDSVADPERIMRLVEACCFRVHELDIKQWITEYKKHWRNSSRPIVNEHLGEMISNALRPKVIEAMREKKEVPSDCTIPPSFASLSSITKIDEQRVPLMLQSLKYFQHSGIGVQSEEFLQPLAAESSKKYTVEDRLNVRIHSSITQSDEYLKNKAVLRSLILEAQRFKVANETEFSEELRRKTLEDLSAREIEEQAVLSGQINVQALSSVTPEKKAPPKKSRAKKLAAPDTSAASAEAPSTPASTKKPARSKKSADRQQDAVLSAQASITTDQTSDPSESKKKPTKKGAKSNVEVTTVNPDDQASAATEKQTNSRKRGRPSTKVAETDITNTPSEGIATSEPAAKKATSSARGRRLTKAVVEAEPNQQPETPEQPKKTKERRASIIDQVHGSQDTDGTDTGAEEQRPSSRSGRSLRKPKS